MDTRQEILTYMGQETYRPVSAEDLRRNWPQAPEEEFRQLLESMEREGAVIKTRTKRYGLPERMDLKVGRLHAHAKGFGFLVTDDKGEEDVFISADNLGSALHGDRIVVRLLPQAGGKRQEGEVIKILQRAVTQVVGTLEEGEFNDYVTPDDKRIAYDIFIPKNRSAGARTGDKVVAEITRYPGKRRNPEGKIVEVLGKKGDPGIDIVSIVRKYGLPEAFPPEVLQAAEAIGEITPQDMEGRQDLRDWDLVTIDGPDAKDLDDAVSLSRLDNGNFKLGVHIADVGYYVKEGGILDREAFRRAASVYLVDRVIPMLPPKLSNGLCSLNPRVDRLALTCLMEITPEGRVVGREIFPSVIKTKERMIYQDVTRILEEEPSELMERYAPWVPMFREMKELALVLRKRRMERGAIDFEFPESKVHLDEQGFPTAIGWYDRGIADQIIEEFMLAANETVAQVFYEQETPFVYRVHEEPTPDKVFALNEFLQGFGLYLKMTGDKVRPQAFQKLLEIVAGRPEERAVSKVMLRSMQHARYAPECLGHFGLAAKYYCHFTSPIRRYPDLVIHRVIREALAGLLTQERKAELAARMGEYARQSSEREKAAEEAERESKDLKKVEYMLRHLGETFRGTISGVTNFGLFVELENSVEGLVHLSTLTDDYYHFLESKFALVGETTRKMYRIGDPLVVRVSHVDVDERRIDFEPVLQAADGAVEPGTAPEKWLKELGKGSREKEGYGARGRETQEGGRGKGKGKAAASRQESREPGNRAATRGKKSPREQTPAWEQPPAKEPRRAQAPTAPLAAKTPKGRGKAAGDGRRRDRRGADPLMEDYGLHQVTTSPRPYFINLDEG